MKIRLSREDVDYFLKNYENFGERYIERERRVSERLPKASRRGFMNLDDLIAVADWKWSGARVRRLCEMNTEDEVKEISAVSFSAKSERLRIGSLLSLSGVRWPMASSILHFGFPGHYPILDVRAMRSVGGKTSYTLEEWLDYIQLCREAAERLGVSMRQLDKALWAQDKHNQEYSSDAPANLTSSPTVPPDRARRRGRRSG